MTDSSIQNIQQNRKKRPKTIKFGTLVISNEKNSYFYATVAVRMLKSTSKRIGMKGICITGLGYTIAIVVEVALLLQESKKGLLLKTLDI
ncbi:Alba-like domain superfamily [Babesia duncani]|uniref:Alba-like domain superfamily n=1 Tax=Babesia duncani TaxID=323732 RepID=A0AAD9PMI5_9APIC|nr:Alba-like domain superfamily [Babesia duncani]